MKRFIATLVIIVFCLAATGLAQAQGNPFVGTWKMDPEKSKASPNPGPKEVNARRSGARRQRPRGATRARPPMAAASHTATPPSTMARIIH